MLQIEQATNFTSADTEILTHGLNHNAKTKRGLGQIEPYAFFIRDENNQIVGGCNGIMYYGCLYIEQLWISEKYRGQDYGTKLVHAAEQLGRNKGCLFSTLETMDWEALDFYKKLGYRQESEMRGYFNNGVMYVLRKDW